jgi:hypothetical protein
MPIVATLHENKIAQQLPSWPIVMPVKTKYDVSVDWGSAQRSAPALCRSTPRKFSMQLLQHIDCACDTVGHKGGCCTSVWQVMLRLHCCIRVSARLPVYQRKASGAAMGVADAIASSFSQHRVRLRCKRKDV